MCVTRYTFWNTYLLGLHTCTHRGAALFTTAHIFIYGLFAEVKSDLAHWSLAAICNELSGAEHEDQAPEPLSSKRVKIKHERGVRVQGSALNCGTHGSVHGQDDSCNTLDIFPCRRCFCKSVTRWFGGCFTRISSLPACTTIRGFWQGLPQNLVCGKMTCKFWLPSLVQEKLAQCQERMPFIALTTRKRS